MNDQKFSFFKRHFATRKKRIFIAVISLVLLLFILKSFLSGNAKVPTVKVSALSKGSLSETLTVTGPVGGSESIDITSSLHAKITELNVKEGDRVQKGITVLAKIDDEDLQREAAVAEGNYKLQVAQKEDEIRAEQVRYEKAVQMLHAAQNDHTRKSALYDVGALSKADLEASEAALSDAKRELSLFRTKNGKLVLSDAFDIRIENAKQESDKLKSKLESAVLISPIDGTVTRVNTKVGRFADDAEDNKPLITIENLDELKMDLLVSEYHIGKVKVGQEVSIRADILGKGNSVKGKVGGISPTGEKKNFDSSERVIPVNVRITERGSKLIAGITGKAEILLDSANDVFVVPLSAIGDDGSGNSVMQFVSTEADGRSYIRILPVETGIESDMEIELKENPVDETDEKQETCYLTTYNASYVNGTEIRAEKEGESSDGK